MDTQKEKQQIKVISKAQEQLKRIIVNSILANVDKSTIKIATIYLIEETSQNLKDLDADEEFINETKKALQIALISWYNIVEGKVTRARNIVKQELKETKGIKVEFKEASSFVISPTQKETPFAMGKITNLRDYMTVIDEASAGYYINYPEAIKNAMQEITTELAQKQLVTYDEKRNAKSLRASAEIRVRYNLISEDMKRMGDAKYVVATAHANASERCSWWQGKIFIVDFDVANRQMGEYKGKPTQTIKGYIDGKPYYSLKEACENGFLSYNCQHRLVEYYKGIYLPHMNMLEVKKRRDISSKQRYLENQIRKTKSAVELELDETKKREYQSKVEKMTKYYGEFSKENNVPRYDWRLEI